MGVGGTLLRLVLLVIWLILRYRNHALHALFPLISTDILAPFIDLMEDALMDQVPPIVVCMTSLPFF